MVLGGECSISGRNLGSLSKPCRYRPIPVPNVSQTPNPFSKNLTTPQIPAEIYPTDVRSTCHGISAAFGKAGAAVGASVFLKVSYAFCPGGECTKASPAAQVDKGIRLVFICCTVLAVIGFLWTWALVDDTPHDSLAIVEAVYGVEPEKPGEAASLEMIVAKAHAKEQALAEEGKSKEPISQ